MKTIFKISILTILVACFSTVGTTMAQNKKTPFKEITVIPEGKALIYIYRPSRMAGAVYHYFINANDKKVSNIHLYNKTYFFYYADPGQCELWLMYWNQRYSVLVDVEPGKTYYVEVNSGLLKLVSSDKAIPRLKKCFSMETP